MQPHSGFSPDVEVRVSGPDGELTINGFSGHLRSVSEFIRAALASPMREAASLCVEIREESTVDFACLLPFLDVTNATPHNELVDRANVEILLRLADKLGIALVTNSCHSFLLQDLRTCSCGDHDAGTCLSMGERRPQSPSRWLPLLANQPGGVPSPACRGPAGRVTLFHVLLSRTYNLVTLAVACDEALFGRPNRCRPVACAADEDHSSPPPYLTWSVSRPELSRHRDAGEKWGRTPSAEARRYRWALRCLLVASAMFKKESLCPGASVGLNTEARSLFAQTLRVAILLVRSDSGTHADDVVLDAPEDDRVADEMDPVETMLKDDAHVEWLSPLLLPLVLDRLGHCAPSASPEPSIPSR